MRDASRAVEAACVSRLQAAGCVFAAAEARLLVSAAASTEELEMLLARREAGTPLEQVLGWAEFCGLRIDIAPGVFVPRRRTEFLVRQAAAVLRPHAVVVDLCCGSGAIGAALVARLPIELHAADVDPAATDCARRTLAGRGEVHLGDLYDALPADLKGRVDVLTVNAPYVPTAAIATMPPEARLHEPRAALDGGADGLDLHRRVATAAPGWLRTGGHLLIETGRRQAAGTAELVERAGLVPRIVTSERFDATVVIAVQPGEP
jgi:release factor glutamine methyltransferase